MCSCLRGLWSTALHVIARQEPKCTAELTAMSTLVMSHLELDSSIHGALSLMQRTPNVIPVMNMEVFFVHPSLYTGRGGLYHPFYLPLMESRISSLDL